MAMAMNHQEVARAIIERDLPAGIEPFDDDVLTPELLVDSLQMLDAFGEGHAHFFVDEQAWFGGREPELRVTDSGT